MPKRASEPEPSTTITTMVCITCGAEQFFTRVNAIPDPLACTRCGSTVFRSFTTPAAGDEAAHSALEEQAREIEYGDPSPETTQGEVNEL